MENENVRKELQVSAIENGTMIDHIPSGSVFQVVNILNLRETENQVLFGTNLESRKMGRKGIIKVSNKFFQADEINKIALVAPNATLIIIKKFKVASKTKVEVPETVEKIVKCFNPNCITNNEDVPSKFTVIDKNDLKLKCHYCEKITVKSSMVFV
jgi:aspartate carbamoyltransferase regulatory subunit